MRSREEAWGRLTSDGGGVGHGHAHGARSSQQVDGAGVVLHGALDVSQRFGEHGGHNTGHVHHGTFLAQRQPRAQHRRQAHHLSGKRDVHEGVRVQVVNCTQSH